MGISSWRIRKVEQGKVRVEDARGLPPTIPFWLGEAPARTDELSAAVSELSHSRRRPLPGPAAGPTLAEFADRHPVGSRAADGGIPVGHEEGRLGWCPASRTWSLSGSSTKAEGCNWSSIRPSADESTGRGGWPYESGSAARSTSSFRPPPTTTPLCFRWGRSTAFPLKRSLRISSPKRPKTC